MWLESGTLEERVVVLCGPGSQEKIFVRQFKQYDSYVSRERVEVFWFFLFFVNCHLYTHSATAAQTFFFGSRYHTSIFLLVRVDIGSLFVEPKKY